MMRVSVLVALGVVATLVAFGAGGVASLGLSGFTARLVSLAGGVEEGKTRPLIEDVTVSMPGASGGAGLLAVARHEVTVAEWHRCVAAKACRHIPARAAWVQDNHPVSGVSWRDARQYIDWISSQTGQAWRLPKASEWRRLAHNVLDEKVEKLFQDPRLSWAADYANFGKRPGRRTHPVGHFGIEASGVADIAGNVWEWTDTCRRSPTAPGPGERVEKCGGVRVLAGIHMTYQSEFTRMVPTGGCSIGYPPANIGFRLVRDVVGKQSGRGQPSAIAVGGAAGSAIASTGLSAASLTRRDPSRGGPSRGGAS